MLFEAWQALVTIWFYSKEKSYINILPDISFLCSTEENKRIMGWNDIKVSKKNGWIFIFWVYILLNPCLNGKRQTCGVWQAWMVHSGIKEFRISLCRMSQTLVTLMNRFCELCFSFGPERSTGGLFFSQIFLKGFIFFQENWTWKKCHVKITSCFCLCIITGRSLPVRADLC